MSAAWELLYGAEDESSGQLNCEVVLLEDGCSLEDACGEVIEELVVLHFMLGSLKSSARFARTHSSGTTDSTAEKILIPRWLSGARPLGVEEPTITYKTSMLWIIDHLYAPKGKPCSKAYVS